MHVLCYQPSCPTCFSSTDFLEIYGLQDFVLALETDDNLPAPDQGGVWDLPRLFIYEIIGLHDVILLSDLLSYLPGISRAEIKLMIGLKKM